MATSFLQGLIQTLISSLGLKRRLTNLFQLLATLTLTVPALAPFSLVLQAIASWLGVIAVTQSVVAKTFVIDVHTVAAFFSALLLVAKSIPQLAQYQDLIAAIASILSALATGSFFAQKKTTLSTKK